MNADRLKELQRYDHPKFSDGHTCSTLFGKQSSGEYVKLADVLALLSQPASPGEIGEIVELRRNLEFCQQTSEARNKRICELLEQLAALSHPGEQQQLVDADALGAQCAKLFFGKSGGRDVAPINERQLATVCAAAIELAALSAHKASDVPTAGDAALREAAKDQWLPIETVPLDRVVLLCDARGNRWTDVGQLDSDLYIYNSCGLPPTHWMPLPAAPDAQLLERFAGEER
jgi:hypothetical protein